VTDEERETWLKAVRETDPMSAPALWVRMQIPMLLAELDRARADYRHAVSDMSDAIVRAEQYERDAREWMEQRAAAIARAEKAEAFKVYVHKRLDEAGVPADPPSPHREHGCRIGGRLDVALAALAEVKKLRGVLKSYELWEKDLLLSEEAWAGGRAPLPRFTQELYDSWMELQADRNKVLSATDPAGRKT
jgi:hypothetical protein